MSESPTLTGLERRELTVRLAEVHGELLSEVAAIPPGIWEVRGGSAAWSPSEMVEHILLTEASLLSRVREHMNDEPAASWSTDVMGKKELLMDVLPSKGKAKAGERVSRFQGLEQSQVQQALADSRMALEKFLDQTADVPLKAILWQHGIFGCLSGYLWLLYIPLHSERHCGQLKKLRGR